VIVVTMERSAQKLVVILEKLNHISNLTPPLKRARVGEVQYVLRVKDLAVQKCAVTKDLTNFVDTNRSAHTNLFVMVIERLVLLHLLSQTKLNAMVVLKCAGEVVVLALSAKNMISKSVS